MDFKVAVVVGIAGRRHICRGRSRGNGQGGSDLMRLDLGL